jgi:hypothetical protein
MQGDSIDFNDAVEWLDRTAVAMEIGGSISRAVFRHIDDNNVAVVLYFQGHSK